VTERLSVALQEKLKYTFEKIRTHIQSHMQVENGDNAHQAGKLMVTLAAYGYSSYAYYTKSNSTHVEHDSMFWQAALKDRCLTLKT
jgi:hypothetical protein